MLEHLSLNLFFILVGYLIDFHDFFRRWVHKLDKNVWILYLRRLNSRNVLGKEQQECPANTENEWFLAAVSQTTG